MHSNLLKTAFEKAQDTISSDKPTHLSRHLSDFILEDSREPFGEKSLRNYHKLIIQGSSVNLKPYVVCALCHYLGYDSFEAYVMSVKTKNLKEPKPNRSSITLQAFMGIVMLFFFIAYLFSFNRSRRPMSCVLREWQLALEQHFYRMERLMRYMQGEAA